MTDLRTTARTDEGTGVQLTDALAFDLGTDDAFGGLHDHLIPSRLRLCLIGLNIE
jgi:hypothetical protein